MSRLKEFAKFACGAETFHAFVHMVLGLTVPLDSFRDHGRPDMAHRGRHRERDHFPPPQYLCLGALWTPDRLMVRHSEGRDVRRLGAGGGVPEHECVRRYAKRYFCG